MWFPPFVSYRFASLFIFFTIAINAFSLLQALFLVPFNFFQLTLSLPLSLCAWVLPSQAFNIFCVKVYHQYQEQRNISCSGYAVSCCCFFGITFIMIVLLVSSLWNVGHQGGRERDRHRENLRRHTSTTARLKWRGFRDPLIPVYVITMFISFPFSWIPWSLESRDGSHLPLRMLVFNALGFLLLDMVTYSTLFTLSIFCFPLHLFLFHYRNWNPRSLTFHDDFPCLLWRLSLKLSTKKKKKLIIPSFFLPFIIWLFWVFLFNFL